MRIFVPDLTEFFTWLEKEGHTYVVLRGFLDFDKGYPRPGTKQDVDLLVEDAANEPIRKRYGRYKRKQGVICDVYGVTSKAHGRYVERPYYPKALAEYTLAGRRKWKNMFYVPAARAHLLSLIYHLAYQKKQERSGIDISDPALSAGSKYCREIDHLTAETGIALPCTLSAFHALLKKEGYAIPYEHLVSTLQDQFHHEYKDLFLAQVCAGEKGELNMYVIRKVSVDQKTHADLINALRKHYTVLAVKDIPLMTRVMKSRKMRGGKWRRGGQPCIAVIVFDPHPIPRSGDDGKNHPFVFNARQFIKTEIREWFTKTTGLHPKENPIHSTDNEAEAVGHLPLFFSRHEQDDIFHRLADLRKNLS